MLIACPTCGRLQFDMDSVVAEIEQRLESYAEPVEVAVLGCAVNGIGEASHADFGIAGAKNEGLIFAGGKPLRKVPQATAGRHPLRGDRQVARPRRRSSSTRPSRARAPSGWPKIEDENAGDLTPEKIAQMETEAAKGEGLDVTAEPFLKPSRTASRNSRPRRTKPEHAAGPGSRTPRQ